MYGHTATIHFVHLNNIWVRAHVILLDGGFDINILETIIYVKGVGNQTASSTLY